MEEDDRLRPILVNVEKQYMGKEYGVDGAVTGTVRAGDVDKVSDIVYIFARMILITGTSLFVHTPLFVCHIYTKHYERISIFDMVAVCNMVSSSR